MKPSGLNKGDTIALLSLSTGLAGIFPHRLDKAKKFLESEGFKIKEYSTTREFLDGKAGTPEKRAKDLMQAFNDKKVKAIICTIGGMHANEIVPLLDYELIKENPKIFCGYSDISVLHGAIFTKTGLTTFYGPAALTQFGEYPRPMDYTLDYFYKALTGLGEISVIEPSENWTDEFLDWGDKESGERPRKMQVNKGHDWLKKGKAKGKIIGGCLGPLLKLMGTQYNIDYKNKILLIETPEGQEFTKGEPLSYIDSQIMDLRNAGVFDVINGLIIGRGFGYSVEDRKKFKNIIKQHVKPYNFPVLADVNIGHTDPIITLPLNVEVTLDSEKNLFSVDESGIN